MPEAPHEQPKASSSAPEHSLRPEISAIGARLPSLPREGRRGDSPGDCGTGTRRPCQGHTAHTGSPVPPLPVTARLAAQRWPRRAQHRRREAARHRLSPAAPQRPRYPLSGPAASPGALAAILPSEQRAAPWVRSGAGRARQCRSGGGACALAGGHRGKQWKNKNSLCKAR